MKKLYLLSILLIGAFLAGCVSEDIFNHVEEQPRDPNSIRVYLSEGKNTRVELDHAYDEFNTYVTWIENDIIELVLEQGDLVEFSTAYVKTDGSGKQYFEFTLPESMNNGQQFNLIATHGGGGVEIPRDIHGSIILNTHDKNIASDVVFLSGDNSVMISGRRDGIIPGSDNVNIDMRHLGAFFYIKLREKSQQSQDFKDVKLVAVNGGNFPVHITNDISQNPNEVLRYNPRKNIFGTYGSEGATSFIHKPPANVTEIPLMSTQVPGGYYTTFIAWLPIDLHTLDEHGNTVVKDEVLWPDFKLVIDDKETEVKPGRDFKNSVGTTINMFAMYKYFSDDLEFVTREEYDEDVVDEENYVLFPGANFENRFKFMASINRTLQGAGIVADSGRRKQSYDNDDGNALHIDGQPAADETIFTAVVPQGFEQAGRKAISFWMKGTTQNKSLSMEVHTTEGVKYYNLGSIIGNTVLQPAGSGDLSGTVDADKWVKVILDLGALQLKSTAGADLFAIKKGGGGNYDLFIDGFYLLNEAEFVFTLSSEDEITFDGDQFSTTLDVTANVDWKVSGTSADWLLTHFMNTPEGGTIMIIVRENNSGVERTGYVTIEADGFYDKVINVKQGTDKRLIFFETFGDFGPRKKTVSVAQYWDLNKFDAPNNASILYSDNTGNVRVGNFDMRGMEKSHIWFPPNKGGQFLMEGLNFSAAAGKNLTLQYEIAAGGTNTNINDMKVIINGVLQDVPSKVSEAKDKFYVVTLANLPTGDDVSIEFVTDAADNPDGFRIIMMIMKTDPNGENGIVDR